MAAKHHLHILLDFGKILTSNICRFYYKKIIKPDVSQKGYCSTVQMNTIVRLSK